MQKFFSKLSGKEKNKLYIAIIIVLLVVFDRLFLGPVLNKLGMVDGQIQTQENSMKRDSRFLAYEDRINAEYNIFSKYLTKELGEEDIVKRDFLGSIEQLATKSNVSLAKNTFSHIQKQKDSLEYFTSLDCTATLEDMLNFIYNI